MDSFTRHAVSSVLAMALCAVFVVGSPGQSDDCTTAAVEARRTELVRELSSALLPVRLSRREDIEDAILQVATRRVDSLRSPVFMYEVQTPAFAVVKGEVVSVVCNDGCAYRRFVAISNNGASSYKLTGFPDASKDFNRMASDSRLHVGNRSDAESYAGFCLDMAFGMSASQVTVGKNDALLQAARYYQSNGVNDPLESARAWGRRIFREDSKIPAGMEVTQSQTGFEVKIPVFAVAGKEPVIKVVRLSISGLGGCERLP